jgi:hypothetical protein
MRESILLLSNARRMKRTQGPSRPRAATTGPADQAIAA